MAGEEECDRLSSFGIIDVEQLDDCEIVDDREVQQFLQIQQRTPRQTQQTPRQTQQTPRQTQQTPRQTQQTPRQTQQHYPPCPFSPTFPETITPRRPYDPIGLIEPLVPKRLYGPEALPDPIVPQRINYPQRPTGTSEPAQQFFTRQRQDDLMCFEEPPVGPRQPRPQAPLEVLRRLPLPQGPRPRKADQLRQLEAMEAQMALEGVEMVPFPETGDHTCPPADIRWPNQMPFTDERDQSYLSAPWARVDAMPDFDPYHSDTQSRHAPYLQSSPSRGVPDENTILLELMCQPEEPTSPIDNLQQELASRSRITPRQYEVPAAWRNKVHVAPAYAKTDPYPETVDEDVEEERRQMNERDAYRVRMRDYDPAKDLRVAQHSRPWSQRPCPPRRRGASPGTQQQSCPEQRSQVRSSLQVQREAGLPNIPTQALDAAEIRELILQTRARLDNVLKKTCGKGLDKVFEDEK